MSAVFADTFYFIAILSREDEAHGRCQRFTEEFRGRLVTTDFVMLELADALSSRNRRVTAARFVHDVRASARITRISASNELLARAFALYEARPDKEWSLTDCTSFIVMQDHALNEAATGDQHFEQAGFRALFL